MKEEKSIQQLLEMLDNPDAYSEQDIRDTINRDELNYLIRLIQ